MMRWLVLVLAAAAVAASGCMLDAKRLTVSFTMQPDSLSIGSSTTLVGCAVDLNQETNYAENKAEIQGLADVALLGRIQNTLPTFASAEWWITPDATAHTTALAVRANATRLWVGGSISPLGAVQIDWNKSAGHVEPVGLEVLRREVQGDGAFTLYALGTITGTSFRFTVYDPVLVLILDIGS